MFFDLKPNSQSSIRKESAADSTENCQLVIFEVKGLKEPSALVDYNFCLV